MRFAPVQATQPLAPIPRTASTPTGAQDGLLIRPGILVRGRSLDTLSRLTDHGLEA